MTWTDLRAALRHLRRHPRFAAVVIVTLALGIGSVTALFSVADAVLWQPLPFAEPERLVRLWGSHAGGDRLNLNPLDALDFRARARSLTGVAVLHPTQVAFTGVGEPRALGAPRVSASYFATFGIEPALGRFFRRDEEVRGHHRVVVLSHELWRSAFAGDPTVLGRSVGVDGEPHTIVGVAPAGTRHFAYERPQTAELWRPLAVDPERQGRGGHFVHAAARLAPGATVDQAQAELRAIIAQLAAAHPEIETYWGVRVEPLREAVAGEARPALLLLLAAGGLVLLIACGNVATLLLARGVSRRAEVSLRVALGAGGGRLVRQLLAEGALLALLGGAGGVLLAAVLVASFRRLGAAQIPRLELATIDGRTLVVATAAALLTVALFAVAPTARLLRRGSLTPAAARGAAPTRHRLERGLVVAEVALSLVLLVGAGLLLRSLAGVLAVDPGFDPERVVTFGVSLAGGAAEERAADAFTRLEQRLAALPGVEAVGWTSHVPLGGGYSCDGVTPAGSTAFDPTTECAESRAVTPGYFTAMRLRLLDGRRLDTRDTAATVPVVVVNRTLAERWWPGQRAVGQRLKWGPADSSDPWRTVVGVVADVRHFGLDEPVVPEVYMPHVQQPYSEMQAVVRHGGGQDALLAAARRVVRDLDPQVPLVEPRPLADLIVGTTARRRFRAALLGTFAGLALLLSGVGLFGLMAHLVGERRGEIGVRMAVGARREQVLGAVLGEALALGGAGLLLGGIGVLMVPRLFAGLLYGVEPLDPVTLAGAALALLAVAGLAAFLPARRAAAVDPVEVLREA